MLHFSSVRDVRRWATAALTGVAFVLVDLDDSLWLFEVCPDGHSCPLRALRSGCVYA